MAVVSIIGPKGGIGKTTLSINTAAALTRALKPATPDNRVCLVDLDLRLPTISSLLESHPQKTFYDVFETIANKTYQVDFLRTLYRIVTLFKAHLNGDGRASSPQLSKSFALYQNLNPELFHFSEFRFGDQMHELFLHRGEVVTPADLTLLKPLLDRLDLKAFREILQESEENSRPAIDEYINYVEEYSFSILGGEVPILGKKNHRKRINEPAFLVFFLEVLHELFDRFDYVILDTPAGGVNHLSSLMNSIDQVLFVFDMSNSIAVNGSIDALHSFIDYYEEFYDDFKAGRLTGLDKAYVNRLIASQGQEAVDETLRNKKLGIIFNRCQDTKSISQCLDRLREYLDTLDQYDAYKKRIHMVGMVPHHKIINITNNRGALFYDKDRGLSSRINSVAQNVTTRFGECPTLDRSNREIINYLQKSSGFTFSKKISRIASNFS
ncbi:MAG: hypothetical protein COV67_08495 [Nitrospinae bacterium CG11_big_fil_rev_8_21_14_0_20_56_8]|nr:MAG: hypothetical protein COV67_08495 [Nitrospinae bacterium CG11_big_fil_rev_8_21_14_0_20_56_8]